MPDPRPHLLKAVLGFARAARPTQGVLRIALLGSLATDKPVPKDADVLVTIHGNSIRLLIAVADHVAGCNIGLPAAFEC